VKKIVLVAIGIAIILISLSTGAVFAGDNNQNGEHGDQGTGIENGKDGCRAQGGYVFVAVDPGTVWLGGACCPSNEFWPGVLDYPKANQCCNPPDFVHAQPGNHCLCFFDRGYTQP
jgi:hypothetical protein